MRPSLKTISQHALIAVITILATGVMGEILLRVKNSSQNNYVIEMWRYARELKQISENRNLGHAQVPNRRAQLQGIDIAINSFGMRGPEPRFGATAPPSVLLLGSSITLGWGVAEEDTFRSRLEAKLEGKYQVLSGGVGNYNLKRSVSAFKENWRKSVKPSVVLVHYFINDAEYLEPSADSIIFRNSQLAVTLYHIVQGFLHDSYNMESLISHYREVYSPESRGYRDMRTALEDLKGMADEDGFDVIFTIIPDVHKLKDYPFLFIHEIMKELIRKYEWTYIDFYDSLKAYRGPDLWTIPGDPHPNAQAHEIMAVQVAPYLKLKTK